MELNAKISSLEDEVKLLKGEVKLILSEIRTAILSQSNPFSPDAGQALRADPQAPEARPPIRVVKAQAEDEEDEIPVAASPAEPAPETLWPEEEEEPLEAKEEEDAVASILPPYEPPGPAPEPASATKRETPPPRPPQSRPSPTPLREAKAAPSPAVPNWTLMKVAGLMVWAEEALKQVGPERLQILLDLCEFAGYLPKTAKEALTRVMNLGLAVEERATPPTTNECLVILHQLDALLQEEEPAGILRGRAWATK
jgi:hypothetical protein